jgi:tRNA(Leu) C34 or U34 (ribose-2'-O)-methylase TrmL
MSISQLIAQTLMTFKVDASQAKAEIKALQGAEKTAAEETVNGIEKRNSAYESLAKGITKVNAVLAVANEVLKVGGEAFKAYEENSRLSIAAANVSIGALRSSSQGLRTDLDLLKLAAAGNAATFKSTQAQLENAAAAMVAFERAGFEIVALTPDPAAEPVSTIGRAERCALLLGAEGPGLSDAALAAVDRRVRIPMAAGVDSLNVAAASAVFFSGLKRSSWVSFAMRSARVSTLRCWLRAPDLVLRLLWMLMMIA